MTEDRAALQALVDRAKQLYEAERDQELGFALDQIAERLRERPTPQSESLEARPLDVLRVSMESAWDVAFERGRVQGRDDHQKAVPSVLARLEAACETSFANVTQPTTARECYQRLFAIIWKEIL